MKMPRISPKPEDLAERLTNKIFREIGIRRGESLDDFARRMGTFVGTNFLNQLARKLQDLFKDAIKEIARETGISFTFGPLDQRFVRDMLDSPDYAKVLRNYSDSAVDEIRKVIFKATQEPMSWREMREELGERIGVIESRGELIARNEMANVYKNARGFQFRKVDPTGDKYRYTWFGPDTLTTTDICKAIKARAVDGVTHDELLRIIEDVATGPIRMKGFDYMDGRPYHPHFNCRHKPRMQTG